MKGILRLSTSILLLCSMTAFGQDSLFLNIDRVIAQAKSDNISLKKNILQAELAEAEYQKSKEWWLPDLFIGTQIHHLDGSGLNTDGRIFTEVDRQSRWYGGEVNFNWDIGKGIFEGKARKLAAQSASLLNTVTKNEAVIQAIESYYNLLIATAEKEVYEELLSSKDELIRQLTVQVDAELRLSSELLLAKSNKQRLQLNLLESNQDALDAMCQMLVAMNLQGEYNLNYDLSDLTLIELIDLGDISQKERNEHPIVTANKIQLEANQKATDAIKKSLIIPDAGLRYNVGPFGEDYSNTEFTRGLQAYVGWNLPLGQLIYKGDTKIAETQQKINSLEIQEQTLYLSQQILQYTAQLEQAKEILELSEQGGNFALEALDQANIRQKEGIGTTFEVLQAQEEYIHARLLYINAIARYNLAQYKMWIAMGNEF